MGGLENAAASLAVPNCSWQNMKKPSDKRVQNMAFTTACEVHGTTNARFLE
jgi:hypothetical protein